MSPNMALISVRSTATICLRSHWFRSCKSKTSSIMSKIIRKGMFSLPGSFSKSAPTLQSSPSWGFEPLAPIWKFRYFYRKIKYESEVDGWINWVDEWIGKKWLNCRSNMISVRISDVSLQICTNRSKEFWRLTFFMKVNMDSGRMRRP